MVAVVVFEFSGMRCQPLRRALGFTENLMKTVVIYCLGVLTPVVGYFLFCLFSGHIELYLEMLTTSFTFIMMVCAVVALNTWRRQISQEAIYNVALEYESELVKFLLNVANNKEQYGNEELLKINERIKYCQFLLKNRLFLPEIIDGISLEFSKAIKEIADNGFLSDDTFDHLLKKLNFFSIRLNKHFHIKSKA
ncbi:hypothetical protein HPY16_14170 [Vibrio cholerae]|uniref:hypothetical protein n=1 Tax=Vibrio cholerae TaxID=666 RepID=UPI001597E1E0|nr:hypothetical protein [Vibrio cholerae]QKU90835.1 hypothetical protein HPY16_14170 [Vibrio cholerae]